MQKGKLPSPAMIVAVVALIAACAGTSYATTKLAKNSVGTKQLKKNAVVSKKVKNGSLTAADFKRGSLPAGERGPQGEPGPQGAQGPPGRSAMTPLQPGETMRGGFATEFNAETELDFYIGTAITYPFPLADPPEDRAVDGMTNGENCEGNTAEPTAPPNTLCLYLEDALNVKHVGFVHLGSPTIAQGISLSSDHPGTSGAYGTWAYTEGSD